MIFLYSRKLQIILLLCWSLGMTFMYVQITGERPLWLVNASERIQLRTEKARLGAVPETTDVRVEAPAPDPRPAADPRLNRCLALRVVPDAGRRADALVFELDYVPAQTKGFTPEKARDYYLNDAPTYVVALGEPWTSDIGNAAFPVSMPQVTGLNVVVTKTETLRLLIHTRTMHEAKSARLRVFPTEKGMKAEIRFSR